MSTLEWLTPFISPVESGERWLTDDYQVLGMSTRKGTVVKLEEILDRARDTMHGIMKSNPEKYSQIKNPELTADIVGKAAIMIQDMSAKRYKILSLPNVTFI